MLHGISGATVTMGNGTIHCLTQEDGSFKIETPVNDSIFISYLGYERYSIAPGKNNYLGLIYLKHNAIDLKEIRVESPYLQYQKDSLENRIIYGKEIRDAQRKTKHYIKDFKYTADGFFSEIVVGLSGKKKRQKRFFEQLKRDEKSRFIALFYNTLIVKDLTKLDDSTAEQFIVNNPMPYDFARTASTLEINMWIREKFRNFQSR